MHAHGEPHTFMSISVCAQAGLWGVELAFNEISPNDPNRSSSMMSVGALHVAKALGGVATLRFHSHTHTTCMHSHTHTAYAVRVTMQGAHHASLEAWYRVWFLTHCIGVQPASGA
jgi:hypothetical protein